jgi:hypothetical protein
MSESYCQICEQYFDGYSNTIEMNDDKGSKIHITGHEKCVNELYDKMKSVKDLSKKTNKQILKEINYIHKEC